ncbi:MAG TPA: SMP-30/gluconolactonase/LRE family protein [Leadbetterella sp.]|nr:SMP-30/gluconolactonase/LRE family protein [Leadbetterella sp.]
MKRSQKFLLALIIIVGLIYFLVQTTLKAGVFTKIESISDYSETILPTHPGVEDITVDPQTNVAYLSAHDRRTPESTGDIFSINLNDSIRKPINLTKKMKINEFRPHGISFLTLGGKKFLFVISHKNSKNDIIKFEILADSLKYGSKYSSTDFVSPNDILAVSEDQFFVTNDHGSRTKWKALLADLTRIPTGNVVFYDGNTSKIVSEKLTYPNGIALSKDGKTIYVASTLEKSISVFEPQTQTNQLKLVDYFSTTYPPDNIEINKSGNLLVGCHPKLFAFMAHRKNAAKISPSAIIEIDKDNFKNQKTLYLNDGQTISGSSVGAPYYFSETKQNLIIGSVFEPKVLFLEKK